MNDRSDHRCELLKAHLTILFIRTQEEADRVQAQCRNMDKLAGHENQRERCHKREAHLQRKADRYLSRYNALFSPRSR